MATKTTSKVTSSKTTSKAKTISKVKAVPAKTNPIAKNVEVIMNPTETLAIPAVPAIPAIPTNPSEVKVSKVKTSTPKVKTSKEPKIKSTFSVTELHEFFDDGKETETVKFNNGHWTTEIIDRYKKLNAPTRDISYKIGVLEVKFNNLLSKVPNENKAEVKELIISLLNKI